MNEILKRRRNTVSSEEPVRLPERRANDKETIMKLVKTHSSLLVPWTVIMTETLKGRQPQLFTKLSSCREFIDGFQLAVSDELDKLKLQRFLRDEGLDVLTPLPQKTANHFWI